MSLPVIATGPRGGKIVGYDSQHNPIYQGSAAAQKLAVEKGLHDDGAGFGLAELLDQLNSALGVSSKDHGESIILTVKASADKVAASTPAQIEHVLRTRLAAALSMGKKQLSQVGSIIVKTGPDGSMVAGLLVHSTGATGDWTFSDLPDGALVAPHGYAASELTPMSAAVPMLDMLNAILPGADAGSMIDSTWHGAIVKPNTTMHFESADGSRYTLTTSKSDTTCKVTVTAPAGSTHWALTGADHYKLSLPAGAVHAVKLAAPKTLTFETTQEALFYVSGYAPALGGKMVANHTGLYVPKLSTGNKPIEVLTTQPSQLENVNLDAQPHDLHAEELVATPAPALAQPKPTWEDVVGKLKSAKMHAPPNEMSPWLKSIAETASSVSVNASAHLEQGVFMMAGHASDLAPNASLLIHESGVDVDPTGKPLNLDSEDGLGWKVITVEDVNGEQLKIVSGPVMEEDADGIHFTAGYAIEDASGAAVKIDASDFANIAKIYSGKDALSCFKKTAIAKLVSTKLSNAFTVALNDEHVTIAEPVPMSITATDNPDYPTAVSVNGSEHAPVQDPQATVEAVAAAADAHAAQVADPQAPQPEPVAMHLPEEPVEAVVSETVIKPLHEPSVNPVLHAFPQYDHEPSPTNWPNWAGSLPPGTVLKAVDSHGDTWAASLHVPDPMMFEGTPPAAEVVLVNVSDPAGVVHSGLSPQAAVQVFAPDTANLDPSSDAFQTVMAHWFAGLPIVIDSAGKTHLDTIPMHVELASVGPATEMHPEDLAKYQATHPTDGDEMVLPPSEVANVVKPLKKKGAGLQAFLQQMSGAVQWKWQVEHDGVSDVVQLNKWFANGTYAKPIVADLPNPKTWDDADVSVLLHEDCSLVIEHAGSTWSFTPHVTTGGKQKGAELAQQLGWGTSEHLAQDSDAAADAPKVVVQAAFQCVSDVAAYAMGQLDQVKWLVSGPDGSNDKPVKVNTWAKKGSYAPDMAKGLVHPAAWTDQTVDVVHGDPPNFIVTQNGVAWTFKPVGSAADVLKIQKALTSAASATSGAPDLPPLAQSVAPSETASDVITVHDLMGSDGGIIALASKIKAGDTLDQGGWKKALLHSLPKGTVIQAVGLNFTYTQIEPYSSKWVTADGVELGDLWLDTVKVISVGVMDPVIEAGDQEAMSAQPDGTQVAWADGTTAAKTPEGWDVTHADGTAGQTLPVDVVTSEPVSVVQNVEPPAAAAPQQELHPTLIAETLDKFMTMGDEAFADKMKVIVGAKKLADGTAFVTFAGATWPLKEAIKQACPDAEWSADLKKWTIPSVNPIAFAAQMLILHDLLKNKDKVVLHNDLVAVLHDAAGTGPSVVVVPPPAPPIETIIPPGSHVPTSAHEALAATIAATPGIWKVKAPGKSKFLPVDLKNWAQAPTKIPALISGKGVAFSATHMPPPSSWDKHTAKHDITTEADNGVISLTFTNKSNGVTATWQLVPPGSEKVKAKVHASVIGHVPAGSKKAAAADKGSTPVQTAVMGTVPEAVAVITKPAEPPSPGMTENLSVPDAMKHWGYEVIHSGEFELPKKKKTDKGWVDDGTEKRDVIVALVPDDTTPLAGELMLLSAGVPTKLPSQHMVMRLPVIVTDGVAKVVAPGTPGATERHCFVIDKVKADKAKPVAVTTDAHLGEAYFDDVPDAVKLYASHAGVGYHGLVKLTAKNAGSHVSAGEQLFVVVSKSHMAVFRADGSLMEDYPVELGKYVAGKPNLIREVFDKHIGLSSLAGDNWQKYVQVLHAGSLKVPDPPQLIKDHALNSVVIGTQTSINEGKTSYHSTLGPDAPGAIYGVPLAKDPWQGYVVFGTGNQPDTLYDNGGNIVATGTGDVLSFGGWTDKHAIIAAAGTNVFKHKYAAPPKAEAAAASHAGGLTSESSGMYASRVGVSDLLDRLDHTMSSCPMEGKDAFLFAAPGTANGQGRVHRLKKLDGTIVNRVSFTAGACFGQKLREAASALAMQGKAKHGGGSGYGVKKADVPAFQYDASSQVFTELANPESHYITSQTSSAIIVPRTFTGGTLDVEGHKVGFRVFTTNNDFEVHFEFPESAGFKIREGAQKALVELMASGGSPVEPERCDVLSPHDGDDFRRFLAVRRFSPKSLATTGAFGKATSLHDIIAGFHPDIDTTKLATRAKKLGNQAEIASPIKAVAHGGQLNYYFDAGDKIDHTQTYIKTGFGHANTNALGRVLAVLENGLMGARDRMSHLGATSQSGASLLSDCGYGDADVVFMRPADAGYNATLSSLGGDLTAIINPAIMSDALATFTSNDDYGKPEKQQIATQGSSIESMVGIAKTGESQELLTRTVPTSAIMSIVVPAAHWQTIVDGLKQRGYDSFNGVPVEKFVTVRDGGSSPAGATVLGKMDSVVKHCKATYHAVNTPEAVA